MTQSVKKGLLVAGVIALAVTNANAALTIPAISTDDIYTAATAVIAVLAVVLGVRKAMSLIK